MHIRPAFLAALLCAASPVAAAERNFGVNGFDRIRVEAPFRVRVQTGIAPFARAEGSNAALDRVTMKVEGRTLVIRNNRAGWGGYPGETVGPVEIQVGTHELSAAVLSGAGSLEIDKVRGLEFQLSAQGAGSASIGQVAVDRLNVALLGTSSARIAGSAPQLSLKVRGQSELDGTSFTTKDATIAVQGPAMARLTVTNSATIEAQGAAVIELAGQPACTARAGGSASVAGCR